MATTIKLFFIAMLVFFITDMIWLGGVAKGLYFEKYGPWLRLEAGGLQPNWWAVVMVYLMFAFGLVVFVLPMAQGSLLMAALYGAALGAVIYGIYDFTCLALFKDWPVGMAFIDWAWGTFLCGWSGFVTALMQRYIN